MPDTWLDERPQTILWRHSMTKHLNEFGGDAFDTSIVEAQDSEEDAIVKTQWAAYTRARDSGHLIWVEEARKFDDYYFGNQWDKDVADQLSAQRRPSNTINLVLSTINTVVGTYIKSRQDISFQPMGKGANQDTAASLRFLFKQIALNNKSEHKEKQVFMDGLIQDRGYFYYYLDFSDNLEGEIREEVLDPTDIILDPGAKDYDPETWSEIFISRWMTPEEIGAFYGVEFKEKVSQMAANGSFGFDSLEWEAPNFGGNFFNSEIFFASSEEEVKRVKRIRIIERQHKVLTRTAFFVDRETGDMRRVPNGWSDDRMKEFSQKFELTIMWKPERRVRQTITADRILLHDNWSLFNRISVIPFFPYFRRGRPFGMVRNLISPQDMLNKVTSQELHVVNTTANSGWMFRSGTLVNMDADDLEQRGAKTGLVLEYDGEQPPEKIQPNQIPTGLDRISDKAGVFFRQISGVNDAQLGQQRSDSSKALDSRREGGAAQQEILFDNLDLTRQLRAELMLEIIQAYYTETRLIQVLSMNEDGDMEQSELTINQPVSIGGVEEIKNDLTIGEYAVVITKLPRRDTYDEGVFEQAVQLRELGVQIPDFVLIQNSQMPDKQELVELSKKIAGLAAPSEEEIARQQEIDNLQMRLLTAEVTEKEAQALERQSNAERYQAQARKADADPQVDVFRIQSEATTEEAKIVAQFESNVQDLFTRLELMRSKTSSAERVAQIGSMTTRVKSGLDRRFGLEKELLKLSHQPSTRPASKKTG